MKNKFFKKYLMFEDIYFRWKSKKVTNHLNLSKAHISLFNHTISFLFTMKVQILNKVLYVE